MRPVPVGMALVMAMRARMAAARRLVRAGVCDGCLDKSPRKEISFAHSLPDLAENNHALADNTVGTEQGWV